jgi:hypothetical protein
VKAQGDVKLQQQVTAMAALHPTPTPTPTQKITLHYQLNRKVGGPWDWS